MKKPDMTKIAYFLRGLGIGILVTIIIVTIHDSRGGTTKKETSMSKEEIIVKAKEYGLVEPIDNKLDQILATATPKADDNGSKSLETENKKKEVKTE